MSLCAVSVSGLCPLAVSPVCVPCIYVYRTDPICRLCSNSSLPPLISISRLLKLHSRTAAAYARIVAYAMLTAQCSHSLCDLDDTPVGDLPYMCPSPQLQYTSSSSSSIRSGSVVIVTVGQILRTY